MTFPAAGGVWVVREAAHVCPCGRGPWGGCVGTAGAIDCEAEVDRVLAGKLFLLARQQPWRLAGDPSASLKMTERGFMMTEMMRAGLGNYGYLCV